MSRQSLYVFSAQSTCSLSVGCFWAKCCLWGVALSSSSSSSCCCCCSVGPNWGGGGCLLEAYQHSLALSNSEVLVILALTVAVGCGNCLPDASTVLDAEDVLWCVTYLLEIKPL